MKAIIIYERFRSDYLNADSIRIYAICTNVLDAEESIKAINRDTVEQKEVNLDELINIDLNVWRHDDDDREG